LRTGFRNQLLLPDSAGGVEQRDDSAGKSCETVFHGFSLWFSVKAWANHEARMMACELLLPDSAGGVEQRDDSAGKSCETVFHGFSLGC